MSSKKATLRALIISILALTMCVSMLVGTTYAWFTDTVSSGVNVIRSGFLRVDLIDENGQSLQGKTLKFRQGNTLTENVLFEPGTSCTLQGMFVENLGNVAIDYTFVVNGLQGDEKLLEVISWKATIDGREYALESDDITGTLEAGQISERIDITGTMPDELEDTYQDLTVTGFSVTVFATQAVGENEKDSFSGNYDSMAEFLPQDENGNFLIYDSAQLKYLAYTVNRGVSYSGKNVLLMNDIDLENIDWTPIGTEKHPFSGKFDGQDYTISNYNVRGQKNVGLFGYVNGGGTISNLSVENVYMEANDYAGAVLGRGYTSITNCHAKNVEITVLPYLDGTVYDGGAKAGGIVGQILEGRFKIEKCSAKNVKILGYRDLGGVVGIMNGGVTATNISASDVYLGFVEVPRYKDSTAKRCRGLLVGRTLENNEVDFTDAVNNGYHQVTVVSDGAKLKDAISNNNQYIGFVDDIVLNEALEIKNSVTLISNGARLSVKNGDRVINVEDVTDGINVTLSGVFVDGSAIERGISLHNNSGKVTLTVENCEVAAKKYAVNVAKGNNAPNIIVHNSKLTGYTAFQTWSEKTTATFTYSVIAGINQWNDPTGENAGTNDFAAVVVNDIAIETKLDFANCTVAAVEYGTAKEYHYSDRVGGTLVSWENCSFTKNGEACKLLSLIP